MRRLSAFLLCAALCGLSGCLRPPDPVTSGSGSTSSAASSSTITRKTYHNETFGFELTYPGHWRVNDNPSNRKLYGFNVIFETGPGVYEGISVNTKTGMSVQIYVRHLKQTIVRSVSDITIGGEKGRRVDTRQDGAIFLFVRHGDAVYQFQTNGDMITQGVISSFRFTK